MASSSRFSDDMEKDELTARDLVEVRAPLEWDKWIYRIAVTTLGLVALSALAGAIVLASAAKPIPEILVAISSAAVGALAGLMRPPGSK